MAISSQNEQQDGMKTLSPPAGCLTCLITNIRLFDPRCPGRQLCRLSLDHHRPPGERKEALPCDYDSVTIIHCNFTRRVLGQLATRLQEIYLKPRACWSQGPFLWSQGQTQEDRQNGVWAFSTVIEFKVIPTH